VNKICDYLDMDENAVFIDRLKKKNEMKKRMKKGHYYF